MAMFGSGLLDLLKAEDPAVAHGLLQAGLSLLSSRGKFGNALGGAGMAGIQGAQQFKERQFQRQLQEQQMKQMQRAEQMQALPGKFMKPPSAPAFDATGGMETAVENPNNASGPGGFDLNGYVNAMMGLDPLQALRMQEMTKKTVPQPFKIGNNERLLEPGTNRVLVDALPDKADKPPGSVQEYEYARGQGYKGTFEQWDTARKRAGASSVSVNTGQKGFDNTLKLRGDFRSEPIYKAHSEVQAAHSQITAGLKLQSPAGDLAGATKLMKILDPTSVVRESELGMAMAATGLLDKAQNYAQRIISGQKLTPMQRADFQNLANQLNAESAKFYNAKRSEYEGIARRNQLDVRDVLGDQADTAPSGMPDMSAIDAELARRRGGR